MLIAQANWRQYKCAADSPIDKNSCSWTIAYVLDPKILLLDEPFSSLDQPTREALLTDLQQIFKLTGVTIVFVTHERQEAMTWSNRVGILSRSKLLQLDANREVFMHPIDDEVAKIVGPHGPCAGSV